MKGERIYIDKAIWNVRVVLVGLHQSEPCSRLVAESGLVVEVESRANDGISVIDTGVVVPVVTSLVALASDGPNELQDWVVEVELHTYLGVGGLHVEGLILNNQNFVVCGGKPVTFDIIKVHICGLEAGGQIVWREAARGLAVLDGDVCSGNNDTSFKTFKFDVNLDTMELQRRKRKGLATVLCEPEREWHIQDSALSTVAN